jgi:exonuclease VII large subunit
VKKKKRKYANVIMLLLIIFVLFFIVYQDKNKVVSSVELVESYSINQKTADNIFLDKDIELSGSVKSFIQSESGHSFLELQTNSENLKLLCLIKEESAVQKASSLTNGSRINVFGKCLGLNPTGYEKFPNSIFIEVEWIK